jgi:hypothetical protein
LNSPVHCLKVGLAMVYRYVSGGVYQAGLKCVPGGFQTRPYVRLQSAAFEALTGRSMQEFVCVRRRIYLLRFG